MSDRHRPPLPVHDGDFLVASNAPVGYWGEIAETEFDDLLELLSTSSHFDRTVLDFFSSHPRRDLYPYITDTAGRSAWLSLLHGAAGELAVDLGAGLGAIAEALSARFVKVWAVEGCRKRCTFLAHRRRLKGLQGIEVVHSDVVELPLDSGSADLAVCNGGLEWVAVGRRGPVPRIQKAFLSEVARVLKPNGVLYIGIENRFARQYLRGVPDHPGTRYTSLLPRWLATAVLRSQRSTPGFSVPGLATQYRNYTYTGHTIRRLLQAAGFPNVSIACVEPSYDIPRYAFNIKAGSDILAPFFEIFVNRRFHPVRDRLFCNNYWVFASKKPFGADPAAKPVFFGYSDTLAIEGSSIIRKHLQGQVRHEAIVRGTSLLRRQAAPQAEDVASAFRTFLTEQPTPHADADLGVVRSALDTYLGGLLGVQAITSLLRIIATQHGGGRYHGDFWLGNLVFDEAAGRSVLIDAEPQLFGSPELDVADFAIDYFLNQRARLGCENLPQRLAATLGIDIRSRDLLLAALARQVLRYTPAHRSHGLVFTYIPLLREFASGNVPPALTWLTSDDY